MTHASPDAPSDFLEVLDLVRQVDKDAFIRELGIGVNPHIGKGGGNSGVLSDVTAFERQFGVHVSLGKRHPLFIKKKYLDPAVFMTGPVLKRKDGVFHVDLFLDASHIQIGGDARKIIDFASS